MNRKRKERERGEREESAEDLGQCVNLYQLPPIYLYAAYRWRIENREQRDRTVRKFISTTPYLSLCSL
jgi:hypothetical protein